MDREAIAERIIQDHTFYASIGGVLPLPLIDVVTVTAIQIDLIRALARVYEVPFDPATGKALVASITGASAARLGASAVKTIPGVGMITGGIAQAGLSGASTYAVGQLFRQHFAEQGTLADLDPKDSIPAYQELLTRGRNLARSLNGPSRRSVERTTAILRELAELRESGIIDAAEFEQLKSSALASA